MNIQCDIRKPYFFRSLHWHSAVLLCTVPGRPSHPALCNSLPHSKFLMLMSHAPHSLTIGAAGWTTLGLFHIGPHSSKNRATPLTASLIVPPASQDENNAEDSRAEKEDRVWWSFEYFPPRTAQVTHVCNLSPDTQLNSTYEQGLQNLLDRIERMRGLGPEFVDITWSVALRSHAPPPCTVYSSMYDPTTGMREDERAK
jgi:hypothetical protein